MKIFPQLKFQHEKLIFSSSNKKAHFRNEKEHNACNHIAMVWRVMLFVNEKCQLYLQTTFNFHVVSRNSPVTLGFSARHVIDLPSSSVDGTKLNSERVVVFTESSCEKRKAKNIYRKIGKTICSVHANHTCLTGVLSCRMNVNMNKKCDNTKYHE